MITLDAYPASHRAVAEMKSVRTMPRRVGPLYSRYLSHMIEQHPRRIKHRIGPLLGLSVSTPQRSRFAVSSWQLRSGSINSKSESYPEDRRRHLKSGPPFWRLDARYYPRQQNCAASANFAPEPHSGGYASFCSSRKTLNALTSRPDAHR